MSQPAPLTRGNFMLDFVPQTDEEWLKLIDLNPYLTDESKLYIKAQIPTKEANNEADCDRVRDCYKIETTEHCRR